MKLQHLTTAALVLLGALQKGVLSEKPPLSLRHADNAGDALDIVSGTTENEGTGGKKLPNAMADALGDGENELEYASELEGKRGRTRTRTKTRRKWGWSRRKRRSQSRSRKSRSRRRRRRRRRCNISSDCRQCIDRMWKRKGNGMLWDRSSKECTGYCRNSRCRRQYMSDIEAEFLVAANADFQESTTSDSAFDYDS